jgi:uncharacterized protein YcfL
MRKILLLILLSLFLISCKSSKSNCDAYGKVNTNNEMTV